MRIFVYGYRPYDEAEAFLVYGGKHQVEIGWTTEPPGIGNATLARGYDAISIVSTPMPGELIEAFRDAGIKMISTRTVGYDHVDIETAKRVGIHVSNATYSPCCVADYTVMLILMALRKMKRIMQRAELHDFSLPGTIGRELRSCTVGVLGTGKIGRQVIENLSGFGCRILAYGRHRDESLGVPFADLDTILRECDIITLHMPLGDDNYHLIGKAEIEKMRDGAVIVNTARGGLIDTEAMIDGLERGKLGGAALDVVENEGGLFHFDRKSDQIRHRQMSILKDMPNVIFSPHMAFYTREAIGDMVEHSILGCKLELNGQENPWHIC